MQKKTKLPVANVGIAGGGGPGAFANNAATVAEMYDPAKPMGSRWSTVADSQIWRLYHSTAVLTKNGEVIRHLLSLHS